MSEQDGTPPLPPDPADELPSRVDLLDGDRLEVWDRRRRQWRELDVERLRELRRIDEILRSSPGFKGYVTSRSTTAWFISSPEQLAAVKRALGR